MKFCIIFQKNFKKIFSLTWQIIKKILFLFFHCVKNYIVVTLLVINAA